MPDTVRDRFLALDAMRGLAALLVVVHHCLAFLFGNSPIEAYLAVDYFFALSGFVIARTYDDRLRTTLTYTGFVTLRAIRLFPLIWLGAVLGLIGALIDHGGERDAVLLAALNVFAIPTNLVARALRLHAGGSFPLNGPAWSVAIEIVINAIYAACLHRWSARWTATAAVLAGVLLTMACIWLGDIDEGWKYMPGQWSVGFLRGSFSFLIGAAIAKAGQPPLKVTWAAALSLLVLAGILLVPIRMTTRPATDLLFVMIVLPALLWINTRFELPARVARWARAAGALSYPTYSIHVPLFGIALPFVVPYVSSWLIIPLSTAAIILTAYTNLH